MKVKVRKHKKVPAPVAAEQAKRNAPEYRFISDFHEICSIDSEEIAEYCRAYKLTEISLEDVTELLVRNIYIKDNGDRAVLVPLIWLYYGF